MARYNEINVGRYNRFFQKLLAMKGAAPAPQLAGDITPAINLFSGVENRYLEGWDAFVLAGNIVAAAANTSCVRIRNPLTSNVLIVIELLVYANNGAAADFPVLRRGQPTADLTVTVNTANSRKDPRGRPGPTAILSQQNTAPAAPAMGATDQSVLAWAAPVNTNFQPILDDNVEFPLLPGEGLQLNSGIVNQSMLFTFWWRERFLEDSERT